jgi:hypothetical protein
VWGRHRAGGVSLGTAAHAAPCENTAIADGTCVSLGDGVVQNALWKLWLATSCPVFQENFVALAQTLSRLILILPGAPELTTV